MDAGKRVCVLAIACAAVFFSAPIAFAFASTGFVAPTPADGSSQNHSSIEAKLSNSGQTGSFYSFLNLDHSLVGWYRFEGNGTDDSVTNAPGTWTTDGDGAGEAYAPGKFGQAADFDGHTSYDVTLSDPPAASFTVSAWVDLNAITESAALVSDRNGHLLQIGGSDRWQFDNEYSADAVATTGVWTLVTGVYDATAHTETLYVNGAEVISGGGDRAFDEDINIGKRNDDVYLDGKIDDVMIFKRALGADEVAALYDGTNGYDHMFTGLSAALHTFTGYAVDSAANVDSTEDRTVTVTDATNITTCTELEAMSDDPTASYTLGNDIDCAGFDPNHDGKGFVPVGTPDVPFAGSFNGNGHTISNLTIKRPDEDNVGLFGYVYEGSGTGTFQNVTIAGSMQGDNYTGALMGELESQGSLVITNVTSSATILAHGYAVGGILGQFDSGDTLTITNSHATGSVTVSASSDTAQIGGLVGYIQNNGTITGSTASGTVTVTSTGAVTEVGGLAGLFTGSSIANSSASGNVSVSASGDTSHIGGLVGHASASAGRLTVTSSYATGSVTDSGQRMDPGLGGLLGSADDPVDVSQSYATGAISLHSATFVQYGVGGLIGYDAGGGTIDKSYSTGDIAVDAADDVSYGVAGLVGFAGAALSITDSFAERNISMTSDTAYATGAGGLLGWDNASVVAIGSSYSAANIAAYSVTVTSAVGGLVGHLESAGSSISNSFYAGAVVATTQSGDPADDVIAIGGVVGEHAAGDSFTSVFWDQARSGQPDARDRALRIPPGARR